MIKLVEVCEIPNAANTVKKRYSLRELYVNPKHVVSLREEPKFKRILEEGLLPENLDSRQEFTRVTLDKGNVGLEVIVVGAPNYINGKLNVNSKGDRNVLKG